ncbi:MAG: uroporphyrinogen-III C-methyltransferase [Lachnospiraceae bacterium]|nr:uroporphyrinogen-III C-methyltransferase [Lachnospiraceae bacterium]
MTGKVWITGAGSEAGLITVKGLEALRRAQVVVYDDLLDHALLGEAPEGCELVCVGKRKNAHKKEQEEIQALLIDRARRGLQVVRLKGGDPTVFGRGGEEALALEEAGIPYEMIPGVSSCISALEHFGIPITHRGMASSFTVVTGHGAGETAESFSVLAGIKGTLVYLMGLSRAGDIADGLLEAGMDPETPASVLSCAFMPGEKRVDGKLSNLAQIAGEVEAPAILVIGKTAAMHLKSPVSAAPHQTALIVGTSSFTERMAAALEQDGVTARQFPCVEVIAHREEIPGEEELREFDWLVFTSVNGVRIFLEEMAGRRTDIRRLAHLKISCIGRGTAEELEKAHLYADLVPGTFTTRDLARELCARAGRGNGPAGGRDEKILILRAAEGNPVLTNELKNEKIRYKDCKIYRTQYREPEAASELSFGGKTENMSCDVIIFASAGGVRLFLEKNKLPSKARPVCIGPLTAAQFERMTGKKAVVASECSVEGIRQCVREGGK